MCVSVRVYCAFLLACMHIYSFVCEATALNAAAFAFACISHSALKTQTAQRGTSRGSGLRLRQWQCSWHWQICVICMEKRFPRSLAPHFIRPRSLVASHRRLPNMQSQLPCRLAAWLPGCQCGIHSVCNATIVLHINGFRLRI